MKIIVLITGCYFFLMLLLGGFAFLFGSEKLLKIFYIMWICLPYIAFFTMIGFLMLN